MIANSKMLMNAAENAGMKIPEEPKEFYSEENRKEYPHFFCFCVLQLGKPVRYWGEVHNNAEVIANVPVNELKGMRLGDFVKRGFVY